MHIEFAVGCSKEYLLSILQANTDSRVISASYSKKFIGTIIGDQFYLSCNDLFHKLPAPVLEGSVQHVQNDRCLLFADTRCPTPTLLLLVGLVGFLMFFVAKVLMTSDYSYLVPSAFVAMFVLAGVGIYYLAKRKLVDVIRKLTSELEK